MLPVSKARTNKFYIYRQCTYIVYTNITFFSMTGSILFSSDVAGAVLGVVDGMVFTGLEVSDLIFVSENK
jgi:hypothetical protein